MATPAIRQWGAGTALFVFLIALILTTFQDYGLSWDEPVRDRGGQAALRFYLGGARDASILHPVKNDVHGTLFDLAAAAAARWTGAPLYETRHLLIALTGAAGAGAAWALAALAFGGWAGPLAALLLCLIPSWYGHMFINPKDIPFAAAFAWGLVAVHAWVARLPRPGWGTAMAAGAAIGLALGIRLIGAALFVFLLAAAAARLIVARRSDRAAPIPWGRLAGQAAAIYLVAHTIMLVGWPWGWGRPLDYLFRALSASGEFSWDGPVLIAGRRWLQSDLPPGAAFHMLAAKLPFAILAAGLAGCAAAAVRAVRPRSGERPLLLFLLAAVILPPLAVAWGRAPFYDGMRHLLFILPPLAALAAGFLARAAECLAGRFGAPGRWAFAALVAAALALPAHALVRLHPYQYCYFSEAVGGLRSAEGRYDLDYWLTSYREAALELARRAPMKPSGEPARVFVYGEPAAAAHYFPETLRAVDEPGAADYLIVTTRHGMHRRFPGDVLFRVERDGAALAVVKQREGGAASRPVRR
jgi:hypothetical protein